MKNLGLYIGSFSTAGVGVFQMTDFCVWHLSFWATLTGIFIFSLIGGILGASLFGKINKQISKWRGIGQIHLKGL